MMSTRLQAYRGVDRPKDSVHSSSTPSRRPFTAAPAIIRGVQRSPGQLPGSGAHAVTSPRIGRDLGSVPVHTDAVTAQSTRPSVDGHRPIAGGGAAPGDSQSALDASVSDASVPPITPSPSTASPDASVPRASVGVPPVSPTAAPATPATAPATPAAAPATPAAAPATLAWTHVLRHKFDALWFSCGERPAWFSTTATLQASGYTDPARLSWRITEGSDKVGFTKAATGAQIVVESKKGSTRINDVELEVREGAGPGAPAYKGRMTVRKPHRLIPRAINDYAACPPWGGCPVACGQHLTTMGYRIVDNVGGTIVGATVNENFPGAKVDDQPNTWVSPAAFTTVPFWANTDGTFVDNWYVSCRTPAPVAPTDAAAGQGVDQLEHEFYVGSKTPGKGCIVQRHIAHRYLGRTRHEKIVSPVP